MELSQAKIVLENTIKTREDELASFKLASELLNENFKADFTQLETAQTETNALAVDKQRLSNELDEKNIELNTEKSTHEEAKSKIIEQKEIIETLISEKTDLQVQVDTALNLIKPE